MFASTAAFLLAAGVLLVCFATHPKLLDSAERDLREFVGFVFGFEYEPAKPLTWENQVGLAVVGAALIFVSGASMA